MRRREFISLIGGAAASWPPIASAQQTGKPPTIGFLGPDASEWKPSTLAFEKRLHELGWSDGSNVAVEYLWSEGRADRIVELSSELVRQDVSVIVTYGRAAMVLKQATSTIPIVSAITIDPLGSGLVTSLSHPGGNITGLSIQQSEIAGKRLEFLHELVPQLHRLAIMFDAGNPIAVPEARDIQAAAATLGMQAVAHGIVQASDIAPLLESLKGETDALAVVVDDLIAANGARIGALALESKLPTSFNQRGAVQSGALMSYGPSYPALLERAAEIVDKILRGAKPGDIPVEQPTKFELVINLKTAKALGLTIPQTLLATADDVIE